MTNLGGDQRTLPRSNDNRPRLLNFWALILLAVLTILAIYRPILAYDNWWYHLPFASYIWNIGGGKSTFILDPLSQERWRGFPKLWEFLQGLCWHVTGSLNTIVVPQILLFSAYLHYASRKFELPIGYVILACFSSPLLLIEYESAYLDLAVGIAVALAFFVLTDLIADARAGAIWQPWPRAVATIGLFALAGNIKYQGVFACLAVSAVTGINCLVLAGLTTARRCMLVMILLVANLSANTWTIANELRFANPLYPLRIMAGGRLVFAGPEPPDLAATPPVYRLYNDSSVELPGPISFILSASELDWTMRGVVPWYSTVGLAGDKPLRGGPSRTGGWGGLFVLANVWLLCAQIWTWRRLRDSRQQLFSLSAALLLAATACLPRAYVVRYWLFVPLALIPINLRFLRMEDIEGRFTRHLLGATALYGILAAVLSPYSGLLELKPVSQHQRYIDIPPDIRHALTTTGRYCDGEDGMVFRYSTAATGAAGIISRNPSDCQ